MVYKWCSDPILGFFFEKKIFSFPKKLQLLDQVQMTKKNPKVLDQTTTSSFFVLWGQPIKLIQVASNSKLCENQWPSFL
jgi:hypothetical protein